MADIKGKVMTGMCTDHEYKNGMRVVRLPSVHVHDSTPAVVSAFWW